MDPSTLIDRYLIGDLSDEEVAQLDQLLSTDQRLRQQFVIAAATDSGLREVAIERAAEPVQPTPPSMWSMTRVMITILSIAAAVLVMLTAGPLFFAVDSVATLTSSENAAWESDLPTTPGSELIPGSLSLKVGVATIRFHSGAEVVLEAPAELELLTDMKARLAVGAAVIEVPDSATGFIMETPDGYAIDYGTQFAVRVNPVEQTSSFEVIEGEIGVHHPTSGDEVRLDGEGKSATVTSSALVVADSELDRTPPTTPAKTVRLGTEGRSSSVRHMSEGGKWPFPEVLSVKKTNSGKRDQYSFFSFDLSQIDFDRIESAQLRLNLVPSTRGFAARLPKNNRFAIYGLADPAQQDWKLDAKWDDAPKADEGVLLGTFEIPRSKQRGSVAIGTSELMEFLESNQARVVTMILVRETAQIAGKGPGLTHTFASDSHPESVGPILEFSLAP